MTYHNHLRFLIPLSLIMVGFGCGGDDVVITPEPSAIVPELGAVSGTVTDEKTQNPIPDVVVTVLDQRTKTEVDGRYAFIEIAYSDALTVTFEADDYAPYARTFAFRIGRFVLDVAMVPLTNPVVDIQRLLDEFSAAVELHDKNNVDRIQDYFSERYVAADDAVTRFGLATGVIPADFESVTPSILKLYEEFDRIQFLFNNIQVNVIHAMNASAQLSLNIITENGPRPDRQEIHVECQLGFLKETSGWKITDWELFVFEVLL